MLEVSDLDREIPKVFIIADGRNSREPLHHMITLTGLDPERNALVLHRPSSGYQERSTASEFIVLTCTVHACKFTYNDITLQSMVTLSQQQYYLKLYHLYIVSVRTQIFNKEGLF